MPVFHYTYAWAPVKKKNIGGGGAEWSSPKKAPHTELKRPPPPQMLKNAPIGNNLKGPLHGENTF